MNLKETWSKGVGCTDLTHSRVQRRAYAMNFRPHTVERTANLIFILHSKSD